MPKNVHAEFCLCLSLCLEKHYVTSWRSNLLPHSVWKAPAADLRWTNLNRLLGWKVIVYPSGDTIQRNRNEQSIGKFLFLFLFHGELTGLSSPLGERIARVVDVVSVDVGHVGVDNPALGRFEIQLFSHPVNTQTAAPVHLRQYIDAFYFQLQDRSYLHEIKRIVM